jgi:hypothetical protein
MAFVLDMEVPLNETIDFVRALALIGNGIAMDHDDNGHAITAVAAAAAERLEVLKATWRRLVSQMRR